MNEQNEVIQTQKDLWAIIELMGHAQTAGRIEKPGEWGGMIRVDVPTRAGDFRTEFYGISAIYSVKIVSEGIARAHAPRERDITAYDVPIVTREQHQAAVRQLQAENGSLQSRISELERRLTHVKSLPSTTGADQSSGEFDDEEEIDRGKIPF